MRLFLTMTGKPMKVLAALLVGGVAFVAPSPIYPAKAEAKFLYMSGQELNKACSSFLKIRRQGGRAENADSLYFAAKCVQFVVGVWDTVSAEGLTKTTATEVPFCVPSGLDANTIAEIVATFLVLEGKQAELEVASLALGNQVQAEWLSLYGITYDPKDDLVEVALEGLDHMIRNPREIYVESGAGTLESLEIVDADGIKQGDFQSPPKYKASIRPRPS
jgi:hypothetical protein